MTKEQIQELRAKVATNAHGLERDEVLKLIDEIERLWQDLQNSRADVLHFRGKLAEFQNLWKLMELSEI